MKDDAKLFEACASISKDALSYVIDLVDPKLLFMKFRPQADVNARDTFGRTPLYVAAENGRRDIVQYLISKGAEVNAVKQDGYSPLHAAIQSRHKNIAEMLINKGANVNLKAQDGSTPLAIVTRNIQDAMSRRLHAISENAEEIRLRHIEAMDDFEHIVKLLFQSGAVLSPGDPIGFALMIFGVRERRGAVVRLLVENGADIKARDRYGYTILHIAAREGTADIVEYLISKGADVNATNEFSETPLNRALTAHNKETADMLIKHGGIQ